MVEMVKLYPSANGTTHGVDSVRLEGGFVRVRTYCGLSMVARDSRNSRAARWLRRGYLHRACPECNIPAWKQKRFRRSGAVR
jgi:pyrrolysyl-tRNA synthetase-like protein